MRKLKIHKVFIFIALAAILLAFFFILGYSINLTKQIHISSLFFIILFLFLAMSVLIYIAYFITYTKLTEKEIVVDELITKLKIRHIEKQKEKEVAKSHENNIDIPALIESLIPEKEKYESAEKFGEHIFQYCSKILEIVQGVVYIRSKDASEFKPVALYAFYSNQTPPLFIEGETIPGQVAKDKKIVKITEIPEDYFLVSSGLGNAKPSYIIYIPLVDNNITIAVIEMSTFKDIDSLTEEVFRQMSDKLAKVIIKNKLQ